MAAFFIDGTLTKASTKLNSHRRGLAITSACMATCPPLPPKLLGTGSCAGKLGARVAVQREGRMFQGRDLVKAGLVFAVSFKTQCGSFGTLISYKHGGLS